MKYDLILKNGMVVDPANNLENTCDIAISHGVIEKVSSEIDTSQADQVMDVSEYLVVPGIVDSHVHIVRENSKAAGYRMLIRAGVTTAIDFKGPVDRVIDEIIPYGYGLNVGVLNSIFPGNGIKDIKASKEEIKDTVNKDLASGALGIKIIGGHYPLEPETAQKIIEVTNKEKGYIAYHAGTTKNGSNIKGMEEAIKLANGLPLHLAHINSYCRGAVKNPLEEVKMALELLKKSPNIVSESYLASINGTSGEIDDKGLPKSHVTRNCLKMFGYEVNIDGLGKAILEKAAAVYIRIGEEMKLIWGQDAYDIWLKKGYNANVCFSVNPSTSILACATAKDDNGRFIVDAISTDGGAIPRNYILTYGIPLVKIGALSMKELIWKSSYMPAQMFGLINKGHLSIGADADITVVNPNNGKAYMTIVNGKVCMIDGYLINNPGTLLTTERGSRYIKKLKIPFKDINLNQSILYKGREEIYIN